MQGGKFIAFVVVTDLCSFYVEGVCVWENSLPLPRKSLTFALVSYHSNNL